MMKRKRVRLSRVAHAALAELAAADGRPMVRVLEELIERERRKSFLEGLNADYVRLKANPHDWAEYQAEIRSMEGTLMDGLEGDPWVEK